MFEDLKKKSLKKSIPMTVVLFLLAIVLAWIALPKLMNVKNFEDLEPDEIKDQNVKVEMTFSFGYYLEEYKKNTSSGKKTTTHYIYTILTGDEDAEESYLMSIRVPAKYKDRMDEIAERSWEGELSEPFTLVGHIRELESKEYSTFKQIVKEDFQLSNEEFEELTLPYCIDVTGTSFFTGSDVVYVLLFAGACLLVLWGVVRIIKAKNGGFIKAFTQDIASAGYTEASIQSDLNGAHAFSGDDIKVGRLCFYHGMNDTVPRAIPVGKLVWAYQTTITHRTNGVKTGTTYNLVIYVNGSKTATNIAVASEAAVQGILQQMNVMYPWVVVGYSDDLKKMFNKEHERFLQLRYNTVEHVAVEPGFENFNRTVDSTVSNVTDNNATNAGGSSAGDNTMDAGSYSAGDNTMDASGYSTDGNTADAGEHSTDDSTDNP